MPLAKVSNGGIRADEAVIQDNKFWIDENISTGAYPVNRFVCCLPQSR